MSWSLLSILVPCLRLSCSIISGSISIQKTKGANIHNNIQAVRFTEVLHEILHLIFKLTLSDNV